MKNNDNAAALMVCANGDGSNLDATGGDSGNNRYGVRYGRYSSNISGTRVDT